MGKSLLCKVFGHKFGEWVYIVSDSCEQARVCQRDGYLSEERRVAPHQFGEWKYLANGSCEQVRVCERDGYRQKRLAHKFGEWEYISSDSCEAVRVCTRDGQKEWGKVHVWETLETWDDDGEIWLDQLSLALKVTSETRCTKCGATK